MNRHRRAYHCAFAVCLATLVRTTSDSCFAANLEPAGINLGSTSFFDGFGRNSEGFTYLVYAQYSTARSINGAGRIGDDPGKPNIYFRDPKFDTYVLVNQLVYTLPEDLFNGSAHLGIDFILPFVVFDTKFLPPPPIPSIQLNDNGAGFGDLTFGPLLQFKPIIADGRPVFSTRAEFDFIVPTGKYNPSLDINQSSNFFSLNPYVAVTGLPLPHLEVSARLNYLYNFKNYRPALGYLYGNQIPPPVKDAQAGQAGWINFAASYEFPATLHWGINGYYFKQFNLDVYDMLDGSSNPGRQYNDFGKVSILAIGPGVLWEAGPHDKLFFNFYYQTMAENSTESDVFNLHWIHGF